MSKTEISAKRHNKLTLNRPKKQLEEPLTKNTIINREMSEKKIRSTGKSEAATPPPLHMVPVVVEMDVPSDQDIMVIEESIVVKNEKKDYELLYDSGGKPPNKVRPRTLYQPKTAELIVTVY